LIVDGVPTLLLVGSCTTGILLDGGETETTLRLCGYDIIARDAHALVGRMLLDAGLQAPPPPHPPLPSETAAGTVAPLPGDSRPFGLLVLEADGAFLVAGQGLTLDLYQRRPDSAISIDRRPRSIDTSTDEKSTSYCPYRTLSAVRWSPTRTSASSCAATGTANTGSRAPTSASSTKGHMQTADGLTERARRYIQGIRTRYVT
jgi:hypothetical protein